MIREIGGEYWIDKTETTDINSTPPSWLKKFGAVVLTSSGRGAISLMLDQITPKVKSVLLPSYVCDSVIIPFDKAGYKLVYYDLNKDLTAANIELKNLNIGVFFHMGYFGFPTNKNLINLISDLRSQSVIIVEDVTHTLFSTYPNEIKNDFVIGSLRKWFGLPSGGFLAADTDIQDKLTNPQNDFVILRTASMLQKNEYIETKNPSLKEEFLRGFARAEHLLDEDYLSCKIDNLSNSIVHQIDINFVIDSRRENYKYLLKHIKLIKELDVLFENLEADVCPLFFPIYIGQGRDELRTELIKKEIYCPIHWPIPEKLKNKLTSKTKRIYDSVLSIPCDQRYGIDDMARTANAINEILDVKG